MDFEMKFIKLEFKKMFFEMKFVKSILKICLLNWNSKMNYKCRMYSTIHSLKTEFFISMPNS